MARCRHLGARLLDRHAVGEPRDGPVIVRRPRRRLRHRSTPARRCRRAPESGCPRSSTPAIVKIAIVELERRSDRRRGRRELPPPEGVGDHDRERTARLLLLRGRQAARRRARVEHVEELRRHDVHRRVVGARTDGHADLAALVIGDRLETPRLRLPVVKVGRGHLRPRRPRLRPEIAEATIRSARSNGSGRRITASTTLKIAVVAPMPSPSVTIAVSAKPGCRTMLRTAKRKS